MIVDDIDAGVYAPWNAPGQTWQGPKGGQATKSISVEGFQEIHVPRGGIARTRTETVWLFPPAMGGFAAGSPQAALYLFRQLYELANNPNRQPCLIRWRSGGGNEVADSEDGWYIITDLVPNIEFIWNGNIPVTITVVYLGPMKNARLYMGTSGGPIVDNFSGAAINLIAFPFGSTPMEVSFNRTGAEGAIALRESPTTTSPFIPSGTILNLFKGGVKCYDTINTSSNPVPTTTYVNSNWVEVKGTEHNFEGDCVFTNGLAMIVYKASSSCSLYVWLTSIATPAWTRWGDLGYIDSSGNVAGNGQTFSVSKVSLDECILTGIWGTSIALAEMTLHLMRGRFDITVDYRSKNDTGASHAGPIILSLPADGPKIAYNTSFVIDNAVPPNETGSFPATDYGYAAGFMLSSSFPLIFGILYQNQPTIRMPQVYAATNRDFSTGDGGITPNMQRTYAVFAVPFGVNGVYSVLNLQSEGETLAAPFVATVDAAASAGSTGKFPSGTVATTDRTFGLVAALPAGNYDVWFRMKVTAQNSAVAQFTGGIYGNGVSYFSTFSPNQLTTSYAWYKVISDRALNGTQANNFFVSTAATATTDWFVDEAIIVPRKLSVDRSGPLDLWQHFDYDRDTKMVRQ